MQQKTLWEIKDEQEQVHHDQESIKREEKIFQFFL
jgi:hypothetical protein